MAEFGGEVALREVLQKAEQEGGEALLQAISRQAGRHGILALQAAKTSPKLIIEAVEKLPQELAESGLRALKSEPQAMLKILTEVGQEGLEASARHPGIGARIASVLGREGAEVAAKGSDDVARALVHHADDIAKLGTKEKAGLLAMMKQAPGKTLQFLGKHPIGTLTAAVVASFLLNPDAYLGSDAHPGFLERLFKEPVQWIGLVGAALLAIWGAAKVFFAVRQMKRKSA
jgi:hypothetical protein